VSAAPGWVLVDAGRIAARVAEMGRAISRDLAGREPVVAVVILKGAVVFAADLVRHLDLDIRLDFMAVASYGQSTRSSGVVRFEKDLEQDIQGRHVLVIEDIVDTGLTLKYLQEALRRRSPASLVTACLLDKVGRRQVDAAVDYVGFSIPDRFVVGYGLDHAGRYRNLPDVRALDGEGESGADGG
jgi:hypoxanthine phosphoribosyltransferase